MDRFGTRHLVSIFNISSSSVRKYSDRFSKYLSIDGSQTSGRHRSFNEDDLKVFQTIVVLRAENKRWDDITAFLESGQRYEPPEFDENSLAIMSSSVSSDLLERFEAIEERLEKVEDSKEERLLEEIKTLNKKIKAKDKKIGKLYRQLGSLEGKYEAE